MLNNFNIHSKLGLILFSVISLSRIVALAQPFAEKNSAELKLALKKSRVLGSALYIAAHPDDENTAVLASLANERLVRTAYLSLTRGDGGQNLIGTDKGEPLGVIRTQELLAARKIDGGEQYFSRAIDFGYSKSAEETLEVWDREKVLADIVWVIRTFRPDIIITRFTAKIGGHGHHLASAQLAEEAFIAAADPSRFSKQLQHVRPWQAKRLLWNVFTRNSEDMFETPSKSLKLDVGKFNFLLGKSSTELAAEARSMHKCQGFGASAQRGSKLEYFQHTLGEPAGKDLFDNIDLSWARVPNAKGIDEILIRADDMFNPDNPSDLLPLLVTAYKRLNEIEPHYWVNQKRKEIVELIRLCAGLWLEAIADDYTKTPGGKLEVTAMIVNRSEFPVKLDRITKPFTEIGPLSSETLRINQPMSVKTTVNLPLDVELSQPYWLKHEPMNGAYQVKDQSLIGLPVTTSLPPVKFIVSVDGEQMTMQTPILYRWTDPIDGERYRPVEITPEVTINLGEKVTVFSNSQPNEIRFSIGNNTSSFIGKLHIRLSTGWKADRTTIPLEMTEMSSEIIETIKVVPPTSSGVGSLTFEIESGGKNLPAREHVKIQYPHIPSQSYFPVVKLKLVNLDITIDNAIIGYIMGAGDEIPDALQQLGYDVKLLNDEEIGNTDLTVFSAIVTGIRAYNTRTCLQKYHRRLLDFVHGGGVLIDQYNVPRDLIVDHLGPKPFTISKDRVTVEEAQVNILVPDHPVLNRPNRITQADFEEWIQERGLYFPSQWHQSFETMLSCHDPAEQAKEGGILYCRYGSGVYIYTAYSWFRQLPAGVPGAFRLFVNLLSAGK